MKIAPTPSKPHADSHHAKTHESGFEELLHHVAEKPQTPAPQKPPAQRVTPSSSAAHPVVAPAKPSVPAAHFTLAPLPKVGSHVVVDKEKEKRTDKAPAHAVPSQVDQQLVKAAVEPPKPAAAPAPQAAHVAPAAPAQTATAPEVKAALAPLPPLPIEPALAQQDSLRVLLLPHAAKVSVETAEAGRLDMRVDVRDGVAHIRATGDAAPLVDARTNELRVALAQEGLALGNFELGQQQRRDDDPERPSDASGFRRAQPAAKSATEGQKPLDGGLHIHA